MASTVREVMTPNPVTLEASTMITDAARMMRDADIGPVIVTEGGRVRGIVTDRDIVVRAIAGGKDPGRTTVAEICSADVVTVAPDEPIESAIRLMRDRAVRRLPVVEGDRPAGILSIGDLALERDPDSALADISAAPPNQ